MLLIKELCFCIVLPCAFFVDSAAIFQQYADQTPESSNATATTKVHPLFGVLPYQYEMNARDYELHDESMAIDSPPEEISSDEAYLILEETLTQLVFLLDRNDLNEETAFGVLLRTPIMRALTAQDVLELEKETNETKIVEDKDGEDGHDFGDVDGVEGETNEEDKPSALARIREKRGAWRSIAKFLRRLTRGTGRAARRLRGIVRTRLQKHGLLRPKTTGYTRLSSSSSSSSLAWSSGRASSGWSVHSSDIGFRPTLRARVWAGLKKTLKFTGVGLLTGAGYIALDELVDSLKPDGAMPEIKILEKLEDQEENAIAFENMTLSELFQTQDNVENIKNDLADFTEEFRVEMNETDFELGQLFQMQNETLTSLEEIREDMVQLMQELIISVMNANNNANISSASLEAVAPLSPTDYLNQETVIHQTSLINTLFKLTESVDELVDRIKPTQSQSAYLRIKEKESDDGDAEWLPEIIAKDLSKNSTASAPSSITRTIIHFAVPIIGSIIIGCLGACACLIICIKLVKKCHYQKYNVTSANE